MTTTLSLVGFLILTNAFLAYILFDVTPSGLLQRWRDNAQPKEDLPSRLVSKRHEVHTTKDSDGDPWTFTQYFATFQVLMRDEHLEFPIDGQEWGLLVEGDEGTLSRQGTRYFGFRRA
jgi:hypothetical protein